MAATAADVRDGSSAWVVGAGRGIGRAVALRLAAGGLPVGLTGRHVDQLDATADEIRSRGGVACVAPADATDGTALAAAGRVVAEALGPIETLVYAAGINLGPERRWEALTPEAFSRIAQVNLGGAVNAVTSVLPQMRRIGGGRIFVVGSWAARAHLSAAGGPYAATKAALVPLVASLNEEEGRNGVRATLIEPGPVDTEIVDTRPQPPSAEARSRYLRPDDVAQLVAAIRDLPFRVCVNEVIVSPVLNELYLEDSMYPGPIRVSPGGELLDTPTPPSSRWTGR